MKHKTKNKRILLTGGGTGGPASPLLGIVNQLRITNCGLQIADFLWIGTKSGPEKKMVEDENIKFKSIASGKLRRYFSWRNFIDPFLILIGFFQGLAIILVWRPNLVIGAGSFVSVPVSLAAWILRVPILIHQQDARSGLANRLMAPFAKVVTVTFEESLKYYGKKAVWTGNPAREFSIFNFQFSINEVRKKFRFNNNFPVILVVGGGTGAMAINELVWQSLDKLTKFCQVIHITGKGKLSNVKCQMSNVKCFEFLGVERMAAAYASADVVVSRCGMGALTELSYLGKPSILIPIPGSHQEDNAKIFKEREAAIVLDQKKLTPGELINSIKKLLDDKKLRNKLSNNIKQVMKKGANKGVIKVIQDILK